jgi:DNA-directed RNA polymerase specialized sigma24 family protein
MPESASGDATSTFLVGWPVLRSAHNNEEDVVSAPPGFEEFVTFRSERLLRAAYQLTHDRVLAEDLLQTALARAWRA